MSNTNKKVWILADDRTGSVIQSLAIAEKLGYDYEVKTIKYNNWVKVPNIIKRASLIGIDIASSSPFQQPYPDIVISAGRRTASVALYIKKQSGGKTFIIQLMNPDAYNSKFDAIILPKHDGKKDSKNVITTIGSVGKINLNRINEEVQKWKKEFKNTQTPKIALIIGGDTKTTRFLPEALSKLGFKVSDLTNTFWGYLMITTSRRTSKKSTEALKNNLHCPNYFYNWNWENDPLNPNKNPLGNPYFAFLGLADYIIVTGDSMSMCSEACSTGKPVYIYAPEGSCNKKHLKFHKSLYDAGYARELTLKLDKLDKFQYEPLDETARVVALLKDKLDKKKGVK